MCDEERAMGDRMQPLPFEQLLERMTEEYRTARSVFGIHEALWYRPSAQRSIEIAGERCATPIGPAAGPHTQLAQNIVSAYLTGSRFIELKTVQILDALELEKPCIDAVDEGYNTEWSTELSLTQAWEEYAKAWILLHLVEDLWRFRPADAPRSFMFNMSVGYDLTGIQSPAVQRFIDRMRNSSNEPEFQAWLRAAAEYASNEPNAPEGSRLEVDARAFGRICGSVTLSTMHGCPPNEIESICRHLIEDKGLHTFVKLNPTLLGFDRVRAILAGLGYDYVALDRDSFDHDLQYGTAIEVLTRLREIAASSGKQFGVKLTNTLPTLNRTDRLPGKQMYMSGRALYPLSISLAARLSREFNGTLPISYSGGISAHNAAEVFATGIRPITLCTTFLKPGGYTRQKQLAELVAQSDGWERGSIEVDALAALAERSLYERNLQKQFRGTDEVRIHGTLPRFDCYRAPCIAACPIGQDVPEYIRLLGEERYTEALELIYERNALPAITGHICDHQCQHACTRLEYDGCLNIRELKKIAARQGFETVRAEALNRGARPAGREARCAVVGAGPTGLSTAYFLAREGFEVTVFEREQNAGGVVRNVIPAFRLPQEAIEQDIAFIEDRGVRFEFGVDAQQLSPDRLRTEGYGPIVLAIGAEVDNELGVEGDRSRVMRSLDFLWAYRGNTRRLELGPRVVVVGGGNTAMDAARAACTLPEVEEVSVLYRRSEAEMPADREEYHNAIADGVTFRFLRNPEQIAPDGTVAVRVMELGEPDETGRRRPVAGEQTETVQADTLITAIGERVDTEVLAKFGLTNAAGGASGSAPAGSVDPETLETELPELYIAGDALTGPSTVVRCIAAGRRVADAIADRHGGRRPHEASGPQRIRERGAIDGARDTAQCHTQHAAPYLEQHDAAARLRRLRERKATIRTKPDAADYHNDRAFALTECHRCLECNYICNKCEEVCPNRANIAVEVGGDDRFQDRFQDPYQIVHLDALCNECGNCGWFCPWSERVPYRDKPTVFSSRSAFKDSSNEGWLLEDETVTMRFNSVVRTIAVAEIFRGAGTADCEPSDEERFMRLFARLHRERPTLFTLIPDNGRETPLGEARRPETP